MRKSIDRLLGPRWSGIVRGSWKWWRDRPLTRGGTAAVRVAAEAYRAMQTQVSQLARAVREQELACARAEGLYLAKVREYRRCQQQLELARQQRHAEHLRAAMYRAQRLERLLPQLKDNVERGDRSLQVARQSLQQEQDRLETYRYQLHELYSRDRANRTLTTVLRMTSPGAETARERFERAKTAIEDRQDYAQALYDLSDAALDSDVTRSSDAALDSDAALNSDVTPGSDVTRSSDVTPRSDAAPHQSGRPESSLVEPGEFPAVASPPPPSSTSAHVSEPAQPVLLPKPQFLPPLQRPQRSR